jgi:hypothetical protein
MRSGERMDKNLLARLEAQIGRGDAILFTGAGFSLGAISRAGRSVPSSLELKQALYSIAFPGEPFERDSRLADVYDCAFRTAQGRTGDCLRTLLSVDATRLGTEFEVWFQLPWHRIYTLNVDDLDEAAQSRFALARGLISLSALTDDLPPVQARLTSVHLNGRVRDFPSVTFSPIEYGRRLSGPDPWYQTLAAEMAVHPVVFVGTQLDEPSLWQHLEGRRAKNRGARELRPGSYLVIPELDKARQLLLERYNVTWVPMPRDNFAEVLRGMGTAREKGHREVAARAHSVPNSSGVFSIEQLSGRPSEDRSEFLMGREPTVSDLTDGFAVVREFEDEFLRAARDGTADVVVLTGTAGSGKSTSLLRAALTVAASGTAVVWLDAARAGALHLVRREIREKHPGAVFVDDADALGDLTGRLLRDLVYDEPGTRVVAAVGSTRYERLRLETHLAGLRLVNLGIPSLSDTDIERLLDALSRGKRLGRLLGKSRRAQIHEFRLRAGRQLLVAMLEATSGERFEEKIDRECRELGPELAPIYAPLALITSLSGFLTREELLVAVGDPTNATLNRLEGLIRQHLVIRGDGRELRLRHRVIAQRSVEHYQAENQLAEVIRGLLLAFSAKTRPEHGRYTREGALLAKLLNHDRMYRLVNDNLAACRQAYDEVEEILSWNYHFWLQRGSLEVEVGDLDLAQNFLEQARALGRDDHRVQTEWAYMVLKRSAQNALTERSKRSAQDAIAELEDTISRRGKSDAYPYHVLGSQGRSWVRRAGLEPGERNMLLGRLLKLAEEGVTNHPGRAELRQLRDDLKREYLLTAIPGSS